jgi:hypothetical protein
VEHGAIDPAALEEALDLMKLVNRTVGQLATAHGLCTPEEANRVAALQREIDGQWGEIAVAAGVGTLVAHNIESLLAEQSVNNLRLSDALVELGHMSASEVDACWSRYEAEAGRVDPIGTLPDEYRSSAIVREVVRVLPRLSIRVLGRAMLLGSARPWTGSPSDDRTDDRTDVRAATIELDGDPPFRLGIVMQGPGHLSQRQLVKLLEAAAWHATRRIDSATTSAPRTYASSDASSLPQGGVAIDVAIGHASCTLVLALEADDAAHADRRRARCH